MLSIDRNIYKQYKDGELSTQQVADYLLRTFPASEIALALAETIAFEAAFRPITITREEFNYHFRIKGTRADGTPENRGKKGKDREV